MGAHGINRELVVGLERNILADSLSYLMHQPMTEAQAVGRRRASVASSNVFVIGNNVREAGFGYFRKIPRSNQVAGLNRNAGACTSQACQNNSVHNPVSVDTIGANTSANNNWSTNDEPQYQDVEYLNESDEDITDYVLHDSNATAEEEHLYSEDDESWCIEQMFAEGDNEFDCDVNESNEVVETSPNIETITMVPFEKEDWHLEYDETWCIGQMFTEGDFNANVFFINVF